MKLKFSSQIFKKILKCQISPKSVGWGALLFQVDGLTDVTKTAVQQLLFTVLQMHLEKDRFVDRIVSDGKTVLPSFLLHMK